MIQPQQRNRNVVERSNRDRISDHSSGGKRIMKAIIKAIRLLGLLAFASMAAPLCAQFAYVANEGAGNVSGFTINTTTGALTPVPGSPFAAHMSPASVTVDP